MLTTCPRPVKAQMSSTSASSLNYEDPLGCADSFGCTRSLVAAAFEEHDLIPDCETPPADDQALSNLRFLSLRVPIYERLVREIDDNLKELSLDSRASRHVSSEYRNELDLLQVGLAKAVGRLAVEHGVHWRNAVVEVHAPQLPEISPIVDAAASPSTPITVVATSVY